MGVTERLLARCNHLKEQLAEKEAMINWLAEKLYTTHNKTGSLSDFINDKLRTSDDWRKAAQEAVKKNES